jgi:hypothetical protein
MSFQIVHPIVMNIDGDSFKDAIKNFTMLNYEMNLANVIITDQSRYMRAKLKYYDTDTKKKAHISLAPINWPVITQNGQITTPLDMWPYSPQITYDATEYPASTFLTFETKPEAITNPTKSNPILISPLVSPLLGNLPSFAPALVVAGSPLSLLSPLGPLVSDVSPLSPMIPTVIRY